MVNKKSKIYSVFLLATLVLVSSCQISKKRIRQLKSKTVIENPFEIQTLDSEKNSIDTSKTDPENGLEGSKKETLPDFHESGPTAVPKIQDNSKASIANNKNLKTTPAPLKNSEETMEELAKLYPFSAGEKIEYTVRYFALEAGHFTFEIKKPKKIQGRPVFHFYISARTSSVFAWVYTLKDYAESFWDMKLKRPYLMKIYGEESRYIREVQTAFDWKKKEARYQAKIIEVGKGLDEEDKVWSLNNSESQDVVSAIYYLRTKNLEVGKTVDIHVAERGKDILVRVKVLKEVEISTKVGKFMTYMVQPTFSVDGNWKQKGDITLWLTKDKYKTPIQFEAKIKIGTIKGRLLSLQR